MLSRKRSLAVCLALITLGGAVLSPRSALSQSSIPQSGNQFEAFFTTLPTAPGIGGSRGETAFFQLAKSLETMTPGEIAAGLPIIDREINNERQPEDRLAKADAAFLLMYISFRPDGATLLDSQLGQLTSMLNEPSHSMSGPAAIALQHIGLRRPDIALPILEAALLASAVNSKASVGPGIVGIIFQIAPNDQHAMYAVVQYMRRPDLTDDQLINILVSVGNSLHPIPDAITAELVRCLDRTNEDVKSRALVGIALSQPTARDAARARVQQIANDTRETAHVRRLAAGALQGKVVEQPDPNFESPAEPPSL